MRLLLLSNSTMKGEDYLGWPQQYLDSFLESVDELLFIPFAGVTMSYDEYTSSVSTALKPTNTKVVGIHTVDDKQTAIRDAQCIAVGGGNTFHLLSAMQDAGIIESISSAVNSGTPYIGWSAGSNVACPTIMTTNDMPIIQPNSFSALNVIDFQINAHYTIKTIDGHGGESRDLRIKELLVVNEDMKVVGLPEGKLLERNEGGWYLKGIDNEPTLLFAAGKEPKLLQKGLVDI
jgi:dipeptidase E